MAEAIVGEHKYRNISGDLLLLGRQMVFMTPDEAQQLVESLGVKIQPDARIEYDKTPHGRERNFISDVSFFSLFTRATVKASDVTDYEGADIIFDLSGEIPAGTIGAFDFIYNGSVLDNVFDPAACMRNISRMLKPQGVVLHYEGVAHFGAAYLKFSADWFFDYYALNEFADAQIYLCAFEHVHRAAWSVYQWDAFVRDGEELRFTPPIAFPGEVVVVVVAEKSPSATATGTPIQNMYRGSRQEVYENAFRCFEMSPRRHVIQGAMRPPLTPSRPFIERLMRPGVAGASSAPGHQLIGTWGRANPAQVF